MGQVVQGGSGQAPARQALIQAGLPATIPALTINKVCGSGLKAVMLASQAIKAGDAECLVAGGQEAMSGAPHYVYGMRNGIKAGNQTMVDGMIHDGLWDSFGCCPHGRVCRVHRRQGRCEPRRAGRVCGTTVTARRWRPPRSGKFKAEIVPVQIPGKGGPTTSTADESPRKDTTAETLAQAQACVQEGGGTVTAGNAPGLNDGSSALVVASLAFAKANGLAPLARVTGYAAAGGEPQRSLFRPGARRPKPDGPKTGASIGDYDLIEANEAFAVQALADGRELGLGLEQSQRQRRSGRARPSDRSERRAGAHHAALRPPRPGRVEGTRYPVSRWRQRGRPQRGDDLMNTPLASTAAAAPSRALRQSLAIGIAVLIVAASRR